MDTPEQAEEAIKTLHDTDFGGRKLVVAEAKPMEKREFTPRSGGGGDDRRGGYSSGGRGGSPRGGGGHGGDRRGGFSRGGGRSGGYTD